MIIMSVEVDEFSEVKEQERDGEMYSLISTIMNIEVAH